MNKAIRRVLVLVVTVAALAMPTVAKADTIEVGLFTLSWEVNKTQALFTVSNFTDSVFGVSFTDLSVNTDPNAGSYAVPGTPADDTTWSGSFNYGKLWDPAVGFLSATLIGRLNLGAPGPWLIKIWDSSWVEVTDPWFGATLADPNGLDPDSDLSVASVRVNGNVVPEPGTLVLVASGLSVWLRVRGRRRT